MFAIVLNIIFLYRPILNLPKSSFKAYLADSNGRGWALLAGLLCGFGNGLQFMGGQAAGYAAADAVQVSDFTNLKANLSNTYMPISPHVSMTRGSWLILLVFCRLLAFSLLVSQ